MHELNKISESISSQSRRDFLTHSSTAMLGMAVCSVMPLPVLSAGTATATSLTHLNGLSLYVTSSAAVPGKPIQNFSEPVDEARYLSQVLFQELMKYEFQYNYYTLASNLGLLPNNDMLGWFNVKNIYNNHRDYFTKHMSEYISAMLQSANRTNTSLSIAQRLPSNTWDMAKANQSIDIVEKGTEFRHITDKLYAACLSYCKSSGAYALGGYIYEDARWARQLKEYYSQNDVLASLIGEFRAEDDGLARFTAAQRSIDGVINKVSILNRAAKYNQISDEDMETFEQSMFGALFSGVALSMRWGAVNIKGAVLARTSSFYDVVGYLTNGAINGSNKMAQFWTSFFKKYNETSFWSSLNDMGLVDLSLRDPLVRSKISAKYPELASVDGGIALETLIYLLGVSHFSWVTVNDQDDTSNPISMIDLGMTIIDSYIGKAFEIIRFAVIKKIAWFLAGRSNAPSAEYFSKFGQFINKLRGTGNVFSNKVKVRAEAILKATVVGKFISHVCNALAIFAVVAATWTLATAILDGNVADIIFGTLNLIMAVVGLIAMALAWTGPVAVAIVVVGLLLALAEWLYSLFKTSPPPPNYYSDFTEQVMRPAQLVLGQTGSFLCRTNWGSGTKVSPFNITNMNYDWMNQPSIDGTELSELRAVITSRRSKYNSVYNFSNLNRARKGTTSSFFTKGTPTVMSGWYYLNARFKGKCTHVAESTSFSGTKVMFAAVLDYDTHTPTLHMSDSFETPPTIDVIKGINYDYGERILDIVGVHDLSDPTFIIFTTHHIYKYVERTYENNGFGTLTNVCNGYNLNASGRIAYVTAFSANSTTNNAVYIYLQTNEDQLSNVYHFMLEPDSMGEFNKLKHVRTTSSTIVPGAAPVSAFSGFAGVYIADVNSPRAYTLGAAANALGRYGTIRIEQDLKTQHTCYNDVAFKLSNNVFNGFYKNAYFPA
ncbi:hypothetical protein OKS68_20580 [Aeromonas veronii]|uniref:hypothetical protein n=1 Tax=Aeromonas veronii TaxID=654 RepID=UPI00226D262E|nr:hypothetical protein [Aeromonas veronii]MCX9134857.1 hypothetical protein [Aeromonas veronii]